MKIYLVAAPGRQSGHSDALVAGNHPEVLVSFTDYASGAVKSIEGFTWGGKSMVLEPKTFDLGLLESRVP